MEISVLSQDRKWEQVEVTDVFVTNKPKLESVLILGQPWFQENAMKVDFPNKTFTLLDGTDIPLVIGREIPAPMQGDQSVNDYFKMIKIYAVTLGIDLDDLKGTFFSGLNKVTSIRGLTPDNQLEVERCGLDLSLDELVARLSVIENIRKNA